MTIPLFIGRAQSEAGDVSESALSPQVRLSPLLKLAASEANNEDESDCKTYGPPDSLFGSTGPEAASDMLKQIP